MRSNWAKVLTIGALAATNVAAQETYRCNYMRREACDVKSPCAPVKIGTAYLLIPALRNLLAASPDGIPDRAQVQRCDDSGCTSLPVVASQSGAFLNVSSPEAGWLLKLHLGFGDREPAMRGSFVEVTTVFLGTLVSYGSCRNWPIR